MNVTRVIVTDLIVTTVRYAHARKHDRARGYVARDERTQNGLGVHPRSPTWRQEG
jgi:hypothetical protein